MHFRVHVVLWFRIKELKIITDVVLHVWCKCSLEKKLHKLIGAFVSIVLKIWIVMLCENSSS